jgi:CrcB protein
LAVFTLQVEIKSNELITFKIGNKTMATIFLIGLGGFIGSVSRYLLGLKLTSSLTNVIHYSTMIINLLGSFAIGALISLSEKKMDQSLIYFLIPGFLGGFTTYSAFSAETFALLKSGEMYSAFIYVSLTLIGGLLLSALGYYLMKSNLMGS